MSKFWYLRSNGFFIFDHCNYARWLSKHIQDLLSLPITCPQLYQEIERGNFVVQISCRQFSQIHYDQAHKQSNKTIKFIKGPIDSVNYASDELINLKVHDVISCLSKNSIAHFVWYLEKEKRYDIKTWPVDEVTDKKHFL